MAGSVSTVVRTTTSSPGHSCVSGSGMIMRLSPAGLAGAAAAALGLAGAPRAPTLPPEAAEAGYVGAARCAQCHAAMGGKWSSGRHSRMLQPAMAATVAGDFSRRALELRGRRYRLRSEAGAFFIGETDLDGRERERRVDFTLGSRRIQHYLTTLPDGLQGVPCRRGAGPGLERQLRGVPRQPGAEGLRAGLRPLPHAVDGLRHELRGLPRSRPAPLRGGQGGGRPSRAAGRRARHHGVRAVPLPARRHRSRVPGRRGLLRPFHADPRVRTEGRQGPGLLARRPPAPVFERRPRLLAEPLLPRGRRLLRDLPPRSPRARRRP